MLRRGEEWTYGEPELNDRGLPVIHNIAEKLGCIRQAPDVDYKFPEGEEDFLELQHRLQTSASIEDSLDSVKSETHDSEHTLKRTERASSSDSEHSAESTGSHSQGQHTEQISPPQIKQETPNLKSYTQPQLPQIQIPQRLPTDFGCTQVPSTQQPSPRSAFTSDSYGPESPFTNFGYGCDDFLGPVPPLEVTAQYLNARQQQRSTPQHPKPERFSFSQSLPYNLGGPSCVSANPSDFACCNDIMNPNYFNGVTGTLGDGTIRPGMLENGMEFDFESPEELMYNYVNESITITS